MTLPVARADVRPTKFSRYPLTVKLDRPRVREKLHQLLMVAASDPNLIIGGFALGGLLLAGLWRFVLWIRDAPTTPDPWDAEVGQRLSGPDAVEVCPHCLTEQPPTAWFCKGCGRAIGPYNNLMPYVQVFSEGEVFRNGTSGRFRNRPLILTGFFLISLATVPLLAPIYWLSLLLNGKPPPAGPEPTEKPDQFTR